MFVCGSFLLSNRQQTTAAREDNCGCIELFGLRQYLVFFGLVKLYNCLLFIYDFIRMYTYIHTSMFTKKIEICNKTGLPSLYLFASWWVNKYPSFYYSFIFFVLLLFTLLTKWPCHLAIFIWSWWDGHFILDCCELSGIKASKSVESISRENEHAIIKFQFYWSWRW